MHINSCHSAHLEEYQGSEAPNFERSIILISKHRSAFGARDDYVKSAIVILTDRF